MKNDSYHIEMKNIQIETDHEMLLIKNKDDKNKSEIETSPMVIFYCPFNQTYTKLIKYKLKDILSLLNSYKNENFFILQIDNDIDLYKEILKMEFQSQYESISKMFDLKLDYCFAPINELLCFNLSIITNISDNILEKYSIQIFFSNNGMYLINKESCNYILKIFQEKFNFLELNNEEFFERVLEIQNNENKIINYTKFNLVKNTFKDENPSKLTYNKRNSENIKNS